MEMSRVLQAKDRARKADLADDIQDQDGCAHGLGHPGIFRKARHGRNGKPRAGQHTHGQKNKKHLFSHAFKIAQRADNRRQQRRNKHGDAGDIAPDAHGRRGVAHKARHRRKKDRQQRDNDHRMGAVGPVVHHPAFFFLGIPFQHRYAPRLIQIREKTLLYHDAAKRPQQNRIYCGFAWFNVLKALCAGTGACAAHTRSRASGGGFKVSISHRKVYHPRRQITSSFAVLQKYYPPSGSLLFPVL